VPILNNQRHERMARSLAEGKPVVQAYEDAGYKPNRSNSHRLKENEGIKSAVAELKGKAAAKLEITLEKLLRDLEEIKANAKRDKQHSAAARATELQAKLAGLMIERREVTNLNAEIDFTRLTEADRRSIDAMIEKVSAPVRRH